MGGSEEEEEGEGDEAFTIKQLKETIKTERDQKVSTYVLINTYI